MDSHDYGHHASGYRKADGGPSKRFMRMDAGELLDSLLATIQHLNRTDAWPLTILPPRWGDVVVDRERRQISAVCLWKRKPIKNHKED